MVVCSGAYHPLGPLVGGLAVDYVSWHMVFLLNIPICLIMLGLLAILPRPPFGRQWTAA